VKIAIIGSGHIGSSLARAWARKGHEIIFGARDPEDADLRALALAGRCNRRRSGCRRIDRGRRARDPLRRDRGCASSRRRSRGQDRDRLYDRGRARDDAEVRPHDASAAEELQKRIPTSRVFKSFNAQGAENLVDPNYGGVPASNFFCGDDKDDRHIVAKLVEDVGFEAIDAGPLKNARLLEPLMLLWAVTSHSLGTREVAFKVLRRYEAAHTTMFVDKRDWAAPRSRFPR
jgi:8-hydroxy-5-deazaflavin:NADPH oxidoreductase